MKASSAKKKNLNNPEVDKGTIESLLAFPSHLCLPLLPVALLSQL